MAVIYPVILLRDEFVITEVGDETVAVSVGNGKGTYNGVIQLKNDPARFMFEKLQTGITLPELIKACMDRYDDTVEDVGPKVIEFLDSLKAENLLRFDTTKGIRVEDGKNQE